MDPLRLDEVGEEDHQTAKIAPKVVVPLAGMKCEEIGGEGELLYVIATDVRRHR